MFIARRNIKTVAIISAFLVLTFINVLAGWIPTLAQEQKQNRNMREILENINKQIEETEDPFPVTFKFVQPLMDNDELFWEIPYSPDEQDMNRWIGEIGDDFVCFYERGGSAYVTRCTPFSNIVSVTYLNP